MSAQNPTSPTLLDSEGQNQKLKVLFVYPPVRLVVPPRVPPMGFLYLAAILEQSGIEVEVLDLNLSRLPFESVLAELRKRTFDVIGIGGMTTVYYYVKLFSLMVKKEFPATPIIGGGSACSASPEVVLNNTGVDVVCVGEGEPIIVDLVTKLANHQSIADVSGIAYRTQDNQIVKTQERGRYENWPSGLFPSHHLVDMETYITNNGIKYNNIEGFTHRVNEMGLNLEQASRPIHIFSKRGCPFGCTFCYRNFGNKVVYDSVDHVLDYIEFLSKTYNTKHFVFADELFNVNVKWVFDFCDRLEERGEKYLFSTSNGLRANCCSQELLTRMREAGFYRVGIGIESFHDPSLKAMKKNQTAEQIIVAIRMIEEVGLKLGEGGMLFGYETDNMEAMRANVDALTELGWYSVGFSIPCPFPGTSLYDKAVKMGKITDEEGWLMELADRDVADRAINMTDMKDGELEKIITWGMDQLALNELNRRMPLLVKVLRPLQPTLRNIFGIDLLGTLYRYKLKARSIFSSSSSNKEPSNANGENHVSLAVGEDGLNLVGKDGLAKFSDDMTTGDRFLLAESLILLNGLQNEAQPNALEFLHSAAPSLEFEPIREEVHS